MSSILNVGQRAFVVADTHIDPLIVDRGGIGETGRFAGKWWPEHWRNHRRARGSAGR